MNKRRISFFVAVAREKCSGHKSTGAPRGSKRRALCLRTSSACLTVREFTRALRQHARSNSISHPLLQNHGACRTYLAPLPSLIMSPKSKSLFLRRRGIKVSPECSAEWHSSNYYDAHFPFVDCDGVKRCHI